MAAPPLLRIAVLAVLCACALPQCLRADTSRLVVVVHSYDTSSDWTHHISEGFYRGLRSAGVDLDLREEYLDARRDSRPEYLARMRDVLAAKYDRRTPDLVVTSDDPALEFLLTHPDLFAGRPVVFGGVESRRLVEMAPRDRFTGVIEEFHLDYILDTALALRPGSRRVFVVTANTRGGEATRREVARLQAARPALTFRDLSAAALPFDRITAILREETRPDDLVIATPVVRDTTDVAVDGDVSIAAIVEASRAPIFGVAFSETGQGVLAATANTGRAHGQWMARKAALLLQTRASPADIPVEIDSETQLAFAADQLERWGIPESALPSGSLVRNSPVSFYREYRSLILAAIGFIAVQTMIIGGLVLNVRRRRHAERDLSRQAVELATANRDLEAANQLLRREHDARRQTEEHLRQAQKMEAVGRLAGGIAHDFNNLLTVIIGYCSLLLDDRAVALDRREALLQMRRASEQAATLTQNLLAFSRRQVASPVVVDMVAGIQALESMLRRFCGESIGLLLQLDDRTGLVELGEGQLEQIVINLVINARDAMPDGGQLVVATRRDQVDQTPADIPDLNPGAYAVLRVSDTGIGMDAETRSRVFEPFFTTKAAGRGTGLGLATVYGIVTQNGGAITVRSEPGAGADFSVWLPLTTRPLALPAHPLGATDPLRGYTVLLVEDEDDLRRLASLVLRKAGLTVLEAAGGAEALRVAAGHGETIDLLLTDVVMPGLDGFEVARRLHDSRPGLAVAYMSGYADQAREASASAVEDGRLLQKPFTPEELLAHVTRTLAQEADRPGATAG
jgi:signal transduction histidine kinase/ActR/RegA family two-component response regulator